MRFVQHSNSIVVRDPALIQELVAIMNEGGGHSPRARDTMAKVYNREQLIEKMERHNKAKVQHAMELVKNISDAFIGVQLVGVSKRVLKHDLGDSFIGIAGGLSSLIGVY